VAEPSPELIRKAQRGNLDAFNDIVLSQQRYVYSLAMRIFHNKEDAEDLVQSTFVRVFRTITQYNGDSRFTTWLYRIVINLARDELRARGRKVPIINPGGDNDEEFDPVTLIVDDSAMRDPQAMLEHNETRRMLERAMNQLEPQFRLVLTLFFFEDLKYNDIADILNIPLNTVKSHIRRGKERLREIILEDSPDSALR